MLALPPFLGALAEFPESLAGFEATVWDCLVDALACPSFPVPHTWFSRATKNQRQLTELLVEVGQCVSICQRWHEKQCSAGQCTAAADLSGAVSERMKDASPHTFAMELLRTFKANGPHQLSRQVLNQGFLQQVAEGCCMTGYIAHAKWHANLLAVEPPALDSTVFLHLLDDIISC